MITATNEQDDSASELEDGASSRRFLCPGCAQEIEVLREHFGEKVECSLCKRRFKADVAKDIQLREQGHKAEQERWEALQRAAEDVQQREEEKEADEPIETLRYASDPVQMRTALWYTRHKAGGWIDAARAVFGSVLWLISVAFIIAGLSGLGLPGSGGDRSLGFVSIAIGLTFGAAVGGMLSFSVALYGFATAFFLVGMANLGEPAVAGLLCLMVGLMICLLVSLGGIGRTLEKQVGTRR